MKKIIILIAFLVSAGHIFGQDIVKIEDYPTTTTTTNSNYVTVYTETPTKAARKIYADYAFPMIYSPGLVRPRSMAANMAIGSTTNPYGDKLYVNGDFRVTGTGFFTNALRLGNPSFYTAIYQNPITGELTFNDPVNGVHNMSEFLSAGSGGVGGTDLTGIPNNSILLRRGDSISYSPKLLVNTLGELLLTSASGAALNVNLDDPYSYGIDIALESGSEFSSGIRSINSSTGANAAMFVTDGGGKALYVLQNGGGSESNASFTSGAGATSTGANVRIEQLNSYGPALSIFNSGTNKSIELRNGSNDLTISMNDSLFLHYLDPAASGTRFLVLTATAALDSGVLNPVKRGLEDKLWDITKHLADRKNGEIKWVHIDDITGDTVSTYGLPQGMDAFESLQYSIEMSLRLLEEQDFAITKQDSLLVDYNKRLALLERKQIRMTRQDYKYKAKLLKLENRLK